MDEIIHGDCTAILKNFPKESFDYILTDPPYGIDKKEIKGDNDLLMYYRIIPELFRVLKNDRFCVIFAPIGKIREFIEITEAVGFHYVWIGFIYYRNIQRLLHTRLGRSKISLYIVFEKGRAKRKYAIRDVVEIIYTPKNTKEFCHPAQKPIKGLMDLMRFGSAENEIILDPFAGSGTTCIVAKKLNRHFIGIEIESKYCNIAKKRLHLPEKLDSFQFIKNEKGKEK